MPFVDQKCPYKTQNDGKAQQPTRLNLLLRLSHDTIPFSPPPNRSLEVYKETFQVMLRMSTGTYNLEVTNEFHTIIEDLRNRWLFRTPQIAERLRGLCSPDHVDINFHSI